MANEIINKILDATFEIVAQNKISGTRMHLIAKEAGMLQSNVHYYYPTKNDLMIALLDRIQERFTQKRVSSVDLDEKSFVENLQGLFYEKKDDILNHKKIDYVQFDYWVQGTANPEIREKFKKSFDIWTENITEVLKQEPSFEENKSVHYAMLPYLIVSIMMGASMQYLMDEEKFDLNDYFTAAEKMILDFLK
ncbi:MAG TPA: TetR/AcrR family transcriptional regulator [Bacillota bacterium]|nr:TetR/AcrR family transcriptional regulator [Bacillota bacterium]HOR85254.1 TetR/AcrR family transcriptional regulator [Bacillota bacterium]HPL52644.1 TetR/AcrR family transcriptional regulator [Bacillota bacterium]